MSVPAVYVSAMGAREEMSGCCRYVPGYIRLSKDEHSSSDDGKEYLAQTKNTEVWVRHVSVVRSIFL